MARSGTWRRSLAAVALAGALSPALDAHAGLVDLAALVGSPLSAYTVFAIAIAIVIVLLLWYAVDDGSRDERRRLRSSRRGKARADDHVD